MGTKLIGLSIADRDLLPGGCTHCAFWESAEPLPHQCPAGANSGTAAAWVRRVAEEWGECGRAAVSEGMVLGFVKYAPPEFFPQARHMPDGGPRPDTVLIACLHIAPEARRHGVGGVLLRAALRDLAQRGEKAAQAYATTDTTDLEDRPMVGVQFLLRHGFTVDKPHPSTPLLRVDLKSLVSWTENLESVLESLRLPVGLPQRASATLITRGKR